MDATGIDALTRQHTTGLSRRRSFGLLASLGLHAVLFAETTGAKKKKACSSCKKRKKGKCKGKKPDGTACENGACQGGSCVASTVTPPPSPPPSPPPPLLPRCINGVKDGGETDIDCGGGTCPRCANGKSCSVDNDCVSGTCSNGVCVACTSLQLCGSDARGICQCHQAFPSNEPVCDGGEMLGLTVDDCSECPPGTETCVSLGVPKFNCYKRCGS